LLRRGQLEVPRPEEGEEVGDEAALWRREVAKVERVISHLIVKDGVLVVVDTPAVCWLHLCTHLCCTSQSVWTSPLTVRASSCTSLNERLDGRR
jgi:hypothetical protein